MANVYQHQHTEAADHQPSTSGQLIPVESNEPIQTIASPPAYNNGMQDYKGHYGAQPAVMNHSPALQSQAQAQRQAPIYGARFSTAPTAVECPRCRQLVTTRIVKNPSSSANVWALVLCCLLGPCCAILPFIVDDCKDVDHSCPSCNLPLASVPARGQPELTLAAVNAASGQSTQMPARGPAPALVQGDGQVSPPGPDMRQYEQAGKTG